MAQWFSRNKKLKPELALVFGFLILILLGSILLSLPAATVSGESTSYLDTLFTSTSAVCVTGLVVYDTGTHWSAFGQALILLMIHIGGLGFMTFGVLFAILLGRKIGLRSRLLLQEALSEFTLQGVVKLATRVLMITLAIEFAATLVLSTRFVPLLGWKQGLWVSFFQAVSAFNNAGFDILGSVTGPFSSITAYAGDPVIVLTLAALFIVGGIGFMVMIDVVKKRRFRNLVLHSKLVLYTTGILILGGTILIYLLEINNGQTLGNMGLLPGIMNAFFQAVTPRTAGFNSITISSMTMASQFVIIMLMFIGASPGSTGGGIKTTTFATMIAGTVTILSQRKDVVLYNRKIPEAQINKVYLILVISLGVIMLNTFLLCISEQAEFLEIFFEVVSAFGTVGLSMGITTELSNVGRAIIIVTMFIGRLGPATVAFAIARDRKKTEIGFPEEKIILG